MEKINEIELIAILKLINRYKKYAIEWVDWINKELRDMEDADNIKHLTEIRQFWDWQKELCIEFEDNVNSSNDINANNIEIIENAINEVSYDDEELKLILNKLK